MAHVKAMFIKLLFIFFPLFLVMNIYYRIDFFTILWMSLILTLGTYLLGDLKILQYRGNVVATLSDFVTYFVAIWAIGSLFFANIIPWVMAALLSSVLISIGEWFFHQYLLKHYFLAS